MRDVLQARKSASSARALVRARIETSISYPLATAKIVAPAPWCGRGLKQRGHGRDMWEPA